MRCALLIVIVGTLTGCTLTPIRLQHSMTGQTMQCSGTYWSWGYWVAKSGQEDCVKTLEAAGYRRLP